MSRKRTLYVSELLERNKNRMTIEVCIKTRTAYHYYPNIESTLKKSSHIDEQVVQWKIVDKGTHYQLFISTFE